MKTTMEYERSVRMPANKETVVRLAEDDPTTDTRVTAQQMGFFFSQCLEDTRNKPNERMQY